MKKLAIITTHPIQYNAPLFREMTSSKKFEIKVFYTWGEQVLQNKFDPGFGKVIDWDIDLLSGYEYEFVKNIAKQPGSHHYAGIDNPDLTAIIEKWNANAILVFGWNFKSHFKAMRYFHNKIQVLFRGDSTLIDQQSPVKKYLRSLVLRFVYKYMDYALYVGKANRAYFELAAVKEDELVFAPHAINLSFFKSDRATSQLRVKLGIEQQDLVFLFAGKLETKKDPLLLVQSFLSVAGPTSHLIIAGDGPLREEIQRATVGISNIHLMPFQNQSEMPALYNAADIFVLPSRGPNETWGLAINEAMACGCAVLVSDKCGAADDLVIKGENGFVFQAGNELDLKTKLDWFQSNSAQLPEFSENSKEHIQKFSYSKMVDSINIILDKNV